MSAKKYSCFKCGQVKPTCKGAKHCHFETKEDRSPVNTQVQVEQKFKELKVQYRARQAGGGSEIPGTIHMGNGEIVLIEEEVPDQENMLNDEDLHAGNTGYSNSEVWQQVI